MKIKVNEILAYKQRLEAVKDLFEKQDPQNRFAYAVFKNYKKLESLAKEYNKDPRTPEFEAYSDDFTITMQDFMKTNKDMPDEAKQEAYVNLVKSINAKHPVALQQKQELLNKEVDFDVYKCYKEYLPNMSASQMFACDFMVSEVEQVGGIQLK